MKKFVVTVLTSILLLSSLTCTYAKNDVDRDDIICKNDENKSTTNNVISYLSIANPSVKEGETISIVVGVETEIYKSELTIINNDTGIEYNITGSLTDEGNLIFQSNELKKGCYIAQTINYYVDSTFYNVSLEQIGIKAQFGVDTIVLDDDPDAVVTDEKEAILRENDSVVVDDSAVSENKLNDSIYSALADQDEELYRAVNGVVTVVLDPGHGGRDGGATSSFNGKSYIEKDLNLAIARYCKQELELYSNVKVYMTRNDDSYVGLEDRVNYAKSVGATVFISIHNNSTSNSKVNGATVYYPNSSYRPELGNQGQALAQNIVSQLVSLGLANHGAIIRNSENNSKYDDGSLCDYYSVIRNSKKAGFPGLIIEHAYLSNANDAQTYLSSDSSLKKLGVADANGIAKYFGLTHAIPGTEYNGINYTLVFDPKYYMENNPDVKNAVADDPQRALEHFVNFGIKEGRVGRPEFNINYYKNKYTDLQQAFGNNLYSYYTHYMNFGIKEGRQACEHFEVFSYRARYADLRSAYGDNLEAYVRHYIAFGKKEGRNGSKDDSFYTVQFVQNGKIVNSQQVEFGHAAYTPNNLFCMNGASLTFDKKYDIVTSDLVVNVDTRYLYNGVDYTDVFNADYYINKYPDIKNTYGTNGQMALSHFVSFGMNEGRLGNDAFNVISYRNRYSDLRRVFGNDLKSYYIHYIGFGKKENRETKGYESHMVDIITEYNGIDYSNVYDYNYYISHNIDVLKAYGDDDSKALAHFVCFGMNEGRIAKSTFNVISYKNRYPDLRKAYGNNLKNYYMHYIGFGSKENREATGYENKVVDAVTEYNGVDYSDVYDFNYYILHNPDIYKVYGYDENKVLSHFITFGMNEGRIAKNTFNVKTYKSRYADLRKVYGNNNKMYYMHYIGFGKKEGRRAS